MGAVNDNRGGGGGGGGRKLMDDEERRAKGGGAPPTSRQAESPRTLSELWGELCQGERESVRGVFGEGAARVAAP